MTTIQRPVLTVVSGLPLRGGDYDQAGDVLEAHIREFVKEEGGCLLDLEEVMVEEGDLTGGCCFMGLDEHAHVSRSARYYLP